MVHDELEIVHRRASDIFTLGQECRQPSFLFVGSPYAVSTFSVGSPAELKRNKRLNPVLLSRYEQAMADDDLSLQRENRRTGSGITS
jgi:hypothetical protein